MERQVIFRDRQEFQAADMESLQSFVDQSLRHLVSDAITGERMFVGLTVTSPSSTELEVAPGRLWDGPEGKVFRKDQPERISVFSHLPVSDQRWLAVSVIGQEVEDDIQPRDFLVTCRAARPSPAPWPWNGGARWWCRSPRGSSLPRRTSPRCPPATPWWPTSA